LEKFTETEFNALKDGLGLLARSGKLGVSENDALLKKIDPTSDVEMEKFTEGEYSVLADGIHLSCLRGLLGISDYHSLLIRLASNRASADSKPEVLIRNVRYVTYSKDGAELAHGYALNHPRLGETAVRTSLVVSKAEDGSSFETLNTRYLIVADPTKETVSEEDSVPDVAATAAVLNSKIPMSKIL
jgi:hypothetical protein